MIDTKLITAWLEQPYRLPADEMAQVAACLERYPYFVPARYMKAGQEQQKEAFSKEMLHEMQSYSGDWLLFYEAMQGAAARDKKKKTEIKEQPAVPVSEPVAATVTVAGPAEAELVQPVFTENYFLHQGINVPDEIPQEMDAAARTDEDEKALMVMMGFDEWLTFLKRKHDRKKSDEEDKAMLKSLWQREKLAAAMDEEGDEIPEAVFEMAINSIDKHDALVSEPLAEIHAKQGRYDKAIEIYRKLSLQNPQKKAYFAVKIDNLVKEKQS